MQKGIPLPLAAVDNQRSMVGLGNLCDFLSVCVGHPAAAGEIFLISDGQDLSTPELLGKIARCMGRSPRLWPLPETMLNGLATLMGKRPSLSRLTGSLQLDIGKARFWLGWRPPVTVDEEIARTVSWFTKFVSSP